MVTVQAAALPLLDSRDEITLSHAGGVGNAELAGELTQFGEHHAGQTATAADRDAVVGRLVANGTALGLGKPVSSRRSGLVVGGSSIVIRAAQKICVAHKGPS
jgi:hypothetical protein